MAVCVEKKPLQHMPMAVKTAMAFPSRMPAPCMMAFPEAGGNCWKAPATCALWTVTKNYCRILESWLEEQNGRY